MRRSSLTCVSPGEAVPEDVVWAIGREDPCRTDLVGQEETALRDLAESVLTDFAESVLTDRVAVVRWRRMVNRSRTT